MGEVREVRQIKGVSWAAEEVMRHFFSTAPDVTISPARGKLGQIGQIGVRIEAGEEVSNTVLKYPLK
jgi:hypothetical protein